MPDLIPEIKKINEKVAREGAKPSEEVT